MNDNEIEKAIDEAPDRIEHYITYAAWLRERSDPWGELMAAQIAADQEPPRKRKLKAAARKVLEHYMATCHPGVDLHLPESPYPEENVQRITWRWGFVEALDLTGLSEPRLAQALPFLRAPLACRLKRLDLGFSPLKELSALAHLASLEQLNLGATHVSDLGPVAGLARLKFLGLGFTKVLDLSPIAGLGALESLNLIDTGVTDLTPLHGLSRLRDLILQKTPVTDEQVEALKVAVPTLRRRGRIDR